MYPSPASGSISELHCACKCFLNLRIVSVTITAVRLWNTTTKEGPALVTMAWLSLSSLQWQLAGLILEDFDSEELSVPHLIARPGGHGILI